MSNLKCHVYFCRYNDCSHCKHEYPLVNDKAECISYVRKSMQGIKNPNLYEYAEDKRFSLNEDEHNIKCQTCSCMNNYHDHCSLNNVRIDASEDKAKCMNFREKNK